ncbi:MAG: hypothetical protein ACR2FY_04640 [Pirellulaceae bacterium]
MKFHDGDAGEKPLEFWVDRLFENENGQTDWALAPYEDMLWAEEDLRWRPEIPTSIIDDVMAVAWLKRPYENPSADWEIFATASAPFSTEAHPGPGYWDIKFVIFYDIVSFVQAKSKDREVAKIASVQWEAGAAGQKFEAPAGDRNFYRVFPEADKPKTVKKKGPPLTTETPDRTIFNKVNLVVTLVAVPKSRDATVYVAAFDPDHRYDPPGIVRSDTFDPNDIQQEEGGVFVNRKRSNDNRFGGLNGANPPASSLGIGADLDKDQLKFLKNVDLTKTSILEISAPQPGNNYIAAATPTVSVARSRPTHRFCVRSRESV